MTIMMVLGQYRAVQVFFLYLLQPPRGCKGMYLFTTISHHHCTALVPKDLSNPQCCRSLIEVVEVGVVVRMEVVQMMVL